MKKSLITLTLALTFTALHAQKKGIVGIWNFDNEVFLEFTEKQLGSYGSDPSAYIDYYTHNNEIIAEGQPLPYKLKGNTLTIGEGEVKITGKRFVSSKKNPLKQGIYYPKHDGYDAYFTIVDGNNVEISTYGNTLSTKYLIEGSKLYIMRPHGRFVTFTIIDSETVTDKDMTFTLISTKEFTERNRYGEIRAAYFQKNYEKAIELAQKAIKETPNDVRFYSILADIYYSQKDYPRTIEVLNQLLLVEPQHVSTMGNLSYYYLFVKDYAAAEQMARKALAIDSTQTWINTNLASAILFQDRYEEAEKIILELKDEDCLNTTCAEAWLDDFTQFQKAGVIPENQKENLRKIQRLLDEDWEKKLTYEQEQKAIEIVTIWFEEMRKANDVNRIMQVSDVPFAFNNERVLSTTGDLREAYSEFFKNKEQTTIPTYEVEIWDYENRIVWGYIPINIVRVVVMINDEDGDVEEQIVVGVSIRDNTFKVVGFY